MVLNSKTMKSFRKTFRHISHMSGHCVYAKCVILMFYSAFRDDCLIVEKISGDAPLVSIFVCILAVRIGETGVSWSMGKVVEDQFLLTE